LLIQDILIVECNCFLPPKSVSRVDIVGFSKWAMSLTPQIGATTLYLQHA
jgi:hypothetical protein